jgi:hypothetical protein
MKKILIIVIVILIIWFAYYAISPLFRVVEVDDSLPENIIEPIDDSDEALPQGGVENLRDDQKKEMEEILKDMNKIVPPTMNDTDPAPEEPDEQNDEDVDSLPASSAVMNTTGHPATGSVRVLQTAEGTVIRYEDFETINGPNLHIYLANDLDAEDYFDLGEIKGTRGNINYTIPNEVDIADYKYVMYWCVPFGVLFNYAEI